MIPDRQQRKSIKSSPIENRNGDGTELPRLPQPGTVGPGRPLLTRAGSGALLLTEFIVGWVLKIASGHSFQPYNKTNLEKLEMDRKLLNI